jgi:hypothetical protein
MTTRQGTTARQTIPVPTLRSLAESHGAALIQAWRQLWLLWIGRWASQSQAGRPVPDPERLRELLTKKGDEK